MVVHGRSVWFVTRLEVTLSAFQFRGGVDVFRIPVISVKATAWFRMHKQKKPHPSLTNVRQEAEGMRYKAAPTFVSGVTYDWDPILGDDMNEETDLNVASRFLSLNVKFVRQCQSCGREVYQCEGGRETV